MPVTVPVVCWESKKGAKAVAQARHNKSFVFMKEPFGVPVRIEADTELVGPQIIISADGFFRAVTEEI
jgi:hypothetical protein